MTFTHTIIISLIAGVLPAVIWLMYWLQEDRAHPEPAYRIFNSFFYGILSVPVVLVFQKIINSLFIQNNSIDFVFFNQYFLAIFVLILWAGIEEISKYVAAYYGGISKKDNDEPIDPIIYLITSALGFAAFENTLFILSPLLAGDTTTALITGNLRFIGATLLHVAASAIIGIFIAFSYYKNNAIKVRYLLGGFILSIALHTIFNSFIIRSQEFTLIGFGMVWISIVVIILLFEKVKKIYN